MQPRLVFLRGSGAHTPPAPTRLAHPRPPACPTTHPCTSCTDATASHLPPLPLPCMRPAPLPHWEPAYIPASCTTLIPLWLDHSGSLDHLLSMCHGTTGPFCWASAWERLHPLPGLPFISLTFLSHSWSTIPPLIPLMDSPGQLEASHPHPPTGTQPPRRRGGMTPPPSATWGGVLAGDVGSRGTNHPSPRPLPGPTVSPDSPPLPCSL